MNTFTTVAALLLLSSAAFAQDDSLPVKTVVDSSAAMFRAPRTFILRAAEKMPEEHYAFRPTPDVRTFAQLLGHIADGYTLVCASAAGDPLPREVQQTEKTKTTKAELIEALTKTGEYCERAHAQLAGARGAEPIDWFGGKHPRATVLFFNSSHAWEHYGNVVTYLRLKGILPPSSEPRRP
jgi:uncharacterized damage-inducible protein DinB